MIHVIGRFVVRDPAWYLEVFASSDVRQRHGCVASRLYRLTTDEHAMGAILTWPSRAAFEAFQVDPAVRDCMRSGGMLAPPVFAFRPDPELTAAEAAEMEPLGEFAG